MNVQKIKDKVNGNAPWLRYASVALALIIFAMAQSNANGKRDKAIEILEKDVIIINKEDSAQDIFRNKQQIQITRLEDNSESIKEDVVELKADIKQLEKNDQTIIQLLYDIKNGD